MGYGGTREKSSTGAVQREPGPPSALSSPSSALERHFSVADVAALWNLSKDAIRDIFRHEDGVLAIGTGSSRGKRRYRTLRIPQSVLERVYREKVLSNHYNKG
jgi:hypothetical protein